MSSKKARSSLTKADMVLISMYHASRGKSDRIPYEEIVIHAWREFPEAYSLRNYPQYPDASDVHKRIYSDLKPNGYAVSLRDKIFRLTDAGILEAQRLIAELNGTSTPDNNDAVRLTRDEQAFMAHVRRSRAYELWQSGQADKLIDFDAQLFFRFGTGTDRIERQRRVKFAIITLQKVRQLHENNAIDLTELAQFLSIEFGYLWGEL